MRATRAVGTLTRVDDDDGDDSVGTVQLGRALRGWYLVGSSRARLSLGSQHGGWLTGHVVVVAVVAGAGSGAVAAAADAAAVPPLRTVRALTPSRHSSSPSATRRRYGPLRIHKTRCQGL